MDEWDAYFWPNSNVLKNKAGLTHAAALRSYEYEATRQRAEQLRAAPLQGRFDTAHYRAIHRHLFQDVYDWAGEYRTVEFSKGSSAFAPLKTLVHTLETWGVKILSDLAREDHLKGLKKAGSSSGSLTITESSISGTRCARAMAARPRSSCIS